MIKRLPCPSFFLTLSCVDLHCEVIPKLIVVVNGHNFCSDELETLNYFENANFQMPIPFYWHVIFNIVYPVFLKKILSISTTPLGKVKNYTIRIKFKIKWSHMFTVFSGFYVSLYYLNQLQVLLQNILMLVSLQVYLASNKVWNCLILLKKYQILSHSTTYK